MSTHAECQYQTCQDCKDDGFDACIAERVTPLLAERDALKSALGNSEKLYTAVCDEIAASKAENIRLREALRDCMQLVEADLPSAPEDCDLTDVYRELCGDVDCRQFGCLKLKLQNARAALAAGKGEMK